MGTKVNNYGGGVISNDGCQFSIYRQRDGSYYISSLFTKFSLRGKGYGKALLKRITKWADKVGVTLKLNCAPFHDRGPPLSVPETLVFYKKAGFVVDPTRRASEYCVPMIYRPQGRA
jgi:GNAT superfamily N-acetyltransferase